jgi:hypothetical protein
MAICTYHEQTMRITGDTDDHNASLCRASQTGKNAALPKRRCICEEKNSIKVVSGDYRSCRNSRNLFKFTCCPIMKLSKADTIALGVSVAAADEADCDPRTSARGSAGTDGFLAPSVDALLLLLAVPLLPLPLPLLVLLPRLSVLRGACQEEV